MEEVLTVVRVFGCVFAGLLISLLLQKRSQQKLQDEIIKQHNADNRTISRIYLERYTKAMKMKNKGKAKQAVELNYIMCPAKDDTCMRRKFCPGCVSDYGWADANVEYHEEDLKNNE